MLDINIFAAELFHGHNCTCEFAHIFEMLMWTKLRYWYIADIGGLEAQMSFQEHQAHKNKNFMTSAVRLHVLSISLKSLYLMCIGLFNSNHPSCTEPLFYSHNFWCTIEVRKKGLKELIVLPSDNAHLWVPVTKLANFQKGACWMSKGF